MGRDKKLGIEGCPKCGNLGRRYKKKVRGRTDQRYIKRWYFLHNDRRIDECYIDNFIRPKQITPQQQSKEDWNRLGHRIKETTLRLCELPLTKDEFMWLANCLAFVSNRVIDPLEELDRLNRQKADPSEIRKFEEIILRNLKSEKNIFTSLNGLKSSDIYQKYIVPAMSNRRKMINEKLRESYNFPKPTLPSLINPDSRYIT